jgi:hypothetical protein
MKSDTYLIAVGLILGLLAYSPNTHAAEREKKTVSSERESHSSHKESHANHENTVKAEILPLHDLQRGKIQTVNIKLTALKDHKKIHLTDLREVHTKKIHVLIFDQTLTDYQHVHPIPTKEAGIYQFDWTPHNEGPYRLWVNIVPSKTGEEEYVRADFPQVGTSSKDIDRKLSLSEKKGENTYSLSFDVKDLKKDKAVMGTIKVVDSQGQGVSILEPVMGAFAHIVAINEDFETIAHVHPMGKEPSNKKDRGGPELQFHFEPEKSGYYKIWLQVQLNGKDVFVPFGVWVE